MSRPHRGWLRVVLALTLAGAGLRPAAAQSEDLAKAQLIPSKVAEGVWMIAGPGGNIGVSAGKDGVVLIDTQFAPLTAKVQAAVAGIGPGPVRFVINTHWHPDHTGGNENLGKSGAVLVGHENIRKRLASGVLQEFLKRQIPPAPEAALPVLTFSESVTFHLNGEELQAFHVPASHTDGDTVVRFDKANVFAVGDLFWTNGYPFIDLDCGGSIDGMLAVLDLLSGTIGESAKLIPGHGPVGTKADLLEFQKMLAAIRTNVQALVLQGKTVEQVVEARPTKAFDDRWGKFFLNGEQFTRLVYQSLTGSAKRVK